MRLWSRAAEHHHEKTRRRRQQQAVELWGAFSAGEDVFRAVPVSEQEGEAVAKQISGEAALFTYHCFCQKQP